MKAPPTHALLKHAVLFLQILNHVQLMAVYPTCEHQEEHLNRPKQWGHCRRVYRSLRHPALFRSLAALQMAWSDYLDNTTVTTPACWRACSWMSCSTTLGSASVDISPNWSDSSAAILRRIRRMIFPERVFGSPGAHWMTSGVAIGLISLRTQSRNSARKGSVGSAPAIKVTYT